MSERIEGGFASVIWMKNPELCMPAYKLRARVIKDTSKSGANPNLVFELRLSI